MREKTWVRYHFVHWSTGAWTSTVVHCSKALKHILLLLCSSVHKGRGTRQSRGSSPQRQTNASADFLWRLHDVPHATLPVPGERTPVRFTVRLGGLSSSPWDSRVLAWATAESLASRHTEITLLHIRQFCSTLQSN